MRIEWSTISTTAASTESTQSSWRAPSACDVHHPKRSGPPQGRCAPCQAHHATQHGPAPGSKSSTPRKIGATCRTRPGAWSGHPTPRYGVDGHTRAAQLPRIGTTPHRSERRRQALQASPPWRKSECQGTSMGWSEVGTPQGIVGLILNHLAIQKAPPATRAQRGWSRARDG